MARNNAERMPVQAAQPETPNGRDRAERPLQIVTDANAAAIREANARMEGSQQQAVNLIREGLTIADQGPKRETWEQRQTGSEGDLEHEREARQGIEEALRLKEEANREHTAREEAREARSKAAMRMKIAMDRAEDMTEHTVLENESTIPNREAVVAAERARETAAHAQRVRNEELHEAEARIRARLNMRTEETRRLSAPFENRTGEAGSARVKPSLLGRIAKWFRG